MKKIIENSKTISEVVRKIFNYHNQKTEKKFYKLVEEKGYDISHLKRRVLKYEVITKKCPVCGKKFKTQKGLKKEKITCSYSCSNTHFRSGESNPNWKDEAYRSTCFLYHKKRCLICKEEKLVTVHHFDGNRKNNKPDNLIPLCPTHHQYVHSRYAHEVNDIIKCYRNKFLKKMKNKKYDTR